ncbi:MAG: beta-N-acetylglucosaminidase domain-containing protein [Cellulosilyticaceae bacterium]
MKNIFPVPQHIVDTGKKVQLTKTLVIHTNECVKDTTKSYLVDALTVMGVEVVMDKSQAEEVATLTFVEATATQREEPIKKEGYTLEIKGNKSAQITITAADGDGMHYGVITLLQMLEAEKHALPIGTVCDYPTILYRGYIEGFYGYPWSHEDRKDLMAFGGKYKLNTYIYAPKDDPYHRKNWREYYPEDKAAQIRELAEEGHKNNLNFVWTIHPGDSIDLDSEEDFQSAILKLEHLYGLGVRQFGVLFDDIGGEPNGLQQAQFINRIDQAFIKAKGDVRPLITVGTRYCEAWGPSMEDYFKPFVDTLHEDIEIMWTGAATMSNIAKEQMDAPKRTIRSEKNLSVWWNYPVNDYCDQKLLMGKIENLGTDIDNINGFFSNPMNQAQASKQALFCIADHNWHAKAYDAEASFEASFKALAPEVAREVQIIAENCSYLREDGGKSGSFYFDESWTMKGVLSELQEAIKKGDIRDQQDVRQRFEEIDKAIETVKVKCKNKKLVQELAPFMEALGYIAKAGQKVIDSIDALDKNNTVLVEELGEAIDKYLEATTLCTVNRLKEEEPRDFVVDAGTLVLKPFVKEAKQHLAVAAGIQTAPRKLDYKMNNIALASRGVTATASSFGAAHQAPEYAISGQIGGGKWCTSEKQPFLTIDLQEPRHIKQYRIINCGHEEAGETKLWNTKSAHILASMDGENFTLIDSFEDNTEDVVNRMLYTPTTARYIRLQIIESAQISINGGHATRINAFELFDEAYPEESNQILSAQIQREGDNLIIHNVQKGDVIALYTTIDGETPYLKTAEIKENQEEVTIREIDFTQFKERVFVERVSKNYLPSIRTSKSL